MDHNANGRMIESKDVITELTQTKESTNFVFFGSISAVPYSAKYLDNQKETSS